ncbi:unnamed protein product (macronuclear) [Paramecium tetraurelia]|uniref:Uncharacterized protein n=1 Tax=Paramecium tetraurelia TaxID=5888 RepID=A0EGP9_PARTE|nr:uncharacterized protein GSPATT00026814001 [Paramecium tetraurelia]CAK94490.1 unnamed protein product [Paramecium tetraurelia]|eukprot:XP_001461863.1 hypothetical protein (macronuclear) [Paramecium tetraurelia strain d4-2]
MINISKQSQKDSMITLMSMNNVCFIGLIILRSGKMEQWRISYLMKKSIIITDRQLSEPMINWMKSQAGQEEEYYEKEAEGRRGR